MIQKTRFEKDSKHKINYATQATYFKYKDQSIEMDEKTKT